VERWGSGVELLRVKQGQEQPKVSLGPPSLTSARLLLLS